jgi:signal transduction histidine kinase/CheY-like chemotaxis protein
MNPISHPVSPLPGTARTFASVEEYDQRITDDAIGHLYGNLRSIAPNFWIMPVVVGYVMWDIIDHRLLFIWIGAFLLYTFSCCYLVHVYMSRQPRLGDGPRWARYATATALISGLLWGFAGIAFFSPGAVAAQIFLYVTIASIAGVSLSVSSYCLTAFFASALPSISMCVARLTYEGGAVYLGLAALLLLILFLLTLVALKQASAMRDVLRLRYENSELVNQLREQMDLEERARLAAEEARQCAEEANVSKSRFLAAASHDLRQPLHALGLFVGALSDRIQHPDERTLLEHINRSVATLESLFNALLDISKLDAGIVQPRIVDMALAPLLAQLSNESEPQAIAKGIAWQCEVSAAVVRSDPALLDTILRNLVSNAIRYTEQGSISVQCRTDEDSVCIDITDTGIGIAAEHQRDIFSEFFQLHNPERDRSKGLGLGLAIVDRLAKLLEHPIQLISSPGQGATFRLTLATGNRALLPPEAEPDNLLSEPAAKGALVVVIDDEVNVRISMAGLLEGWGYRVQAAASGEEALAALTEMPMAIIADYRLREHQTGSDAIRCIQERWGATIPALIVTGDTAPERLRSAMQSGFAFIHKPVPPSRLRAFLRNANCHFPQE